MYKKLFISLLILTYMSFAGVTSVDTYYPPNGLITNASSTTFRWIMYGSAPPNQPVQCTVYMYYVNNVLQWSASTNCNYNTTCSLWHSLSNPNAPSVDYYYWYVKCDSTQSSNKNLGTDFTVPLIQFVPPTPPNSSLTSSTVVLNVSIPNEPSESPTVTFYVDGTPYGGTCVPNSSPTSQTRYCYAIVSSLSGGNHTVRGVVKDSAQNSNSTETRTFYVDTTNPTISFTSPTPLNNSLLNQSYIEVNASANDTNLANITLFIYSTTLVNKTTCNSTPCFANFTNLPDGRYFINATAVDLAGNSNSTETREIILDTTPPNISFSLPTPSNNSIICVNYTEVNVSVNDSNIEEVWFKLDSISASFVDDSLLLAFNFNNESSLGENSTYFFDFSKYNRTNFCNSTHCPVFEEGRYLKGLNFDGIDDYVEIPYSDDLNLSGNFTIEAWVKVRGYGPTHMRDIVVRAPFALWNTSNYRLGVGPGGKLIFVHGNGSTSEFVKSISVLEPGKWYFVAVTSRGMYINGIKEKSFNFVLNWYGDETPLRIGLNNQNRSLNDFNGTIDEVRIYNRALNDTEILLHYILNLRKYDVDKWELYGNITDLSDGWHTIRSFAIDKNNLSNSTEERMFFVDTVYPNASYEPPTLLSSSYIARNFIEVNVSAFDATLQNITFHLYHLNSLLNESEGNTTFINWTSLNDGLYYFNVSVNDFCRSTILETRNVTVDTTNPTISFTSPTPLNNSLLNQSYIEVNASANDTNLANITLFIYSTTLVNKTTCNSTPCFANFTNLPDGRYFINATAVDLAGNSNSTETREIILDTTPPYVENISIYPNPGYPNNVIIISTDVFDRNGVLNVSANISWDHGTVLIPMFYNNSTYTCNFTNTSWIGTYTVRFLAYDTLLNLNDTEGGSFAVIKESSDSKEHSINVNTVDIEIEMNSEGVEVGKIVNDGDYYEEDLHVYVENCPKGWKCEDTYINILKRHVKNVSLRIIPQKDISGLFTLKLVAENEYVYGDDLFKVTIKEPPKKKCFIMFPKEVCLDQRFIISVYDESGLPLENVNVEISPPEGSSFLASTDPHGVIPLRFSEEGYADFFTSDCELQNDPIVIVKECKKEPRIAIRASNEVYVGDEIYVYVEDLNTGRGVPTTLDVIRPDGSSVKVSTNSGGRFRFIGDLEGVYRYDTPYDEVSKETTRVISKPVEDEENSSSNETRREEVEICMFNDCYVLGESSELDIVSKAIGVLSEENGEERYSTTLTKVTWIAGLLGLIAVGLWLFLLAKTNEMEVKILSPLVEKEKLKFKVVKKGTDEPVANVSLALYKDGLFVKRLKTNKKGIFYLVLDEGVYAIELPGGKRFYFTVES